MFYKSLVDFMRLDNAIATTITEFAGKPAIFPQRAPEKAEKPYIIVNIKGRNKSAGVVKAFDIYVNYYDRDQSISKCESAAVAIGDRLDRIILNSDPNYRSIRLFLDSEGYAQNADARDIIYNMLFSASASRDGWGIKYANK